MILTTTEPQKVRPGAVTAVYSEKPHKSGDLIEIVDVDGNHVAWAVCKGSYKKDPRYTAVANGKRWNYGRKYFKFVVR